MEVLIQIAVHGIIKVLVSLFLLFLNSFTSHFLHSFYILFCLMLLLLKFFDFALVSLISICKSWHLIILVYHLFNFLLLNVDDDFSSTKV